MRDKCIVRPSAYVADMDKVIRVELGRCKPEAGQIVHFVGIFIAFDARLCGYLNSHEFFIELSMQDAYHRVDGCPCYVNSLHQVL